MNRSEAVAVVLSGQMVSLNGSNPQTRRVVGFIDGKVVLESADEYDGYRLDKYSPTVLNPPIKGRRVFPSRIAITIDQLAAIEDYERRVSKAAQSSVLPSITNTEELLLAIYAAYPDDSTKPGVVFSALSPTNFYASVVRYKGKNGTKREVVVSVRDTSLFLASRRLIQAWEDRRKAEALSESFSEMRTFNVGSPPETVALTREAYIAAYESIKASLGTGVVRAKKAEAQPEPTGRFANLEIDHDEEK